METSITVIWWVALVGALVFTVVVVKLALLVIRTEKEILQLARMIVSGARGIGSNTALIAQLETTAGVAGEILNVAMKLEASSASMAEKLRLIGRAFVEGRR